MLFKDLEVRKILTDYNESLGESAELDVEKVCGALTKAGGGVEAVAKELSYEEITKAGVPPAVARAIAGVWRASRVEEKPVAKPDMPEVQVGGVEGTFKGLALAIGNVTAFGDKELIEIYEPLGAATVMAELLVRSER
ncbi:hypothetical protein HY771_04035, partial [Candidatus Uhrbacteria bacterium]|nr:hypothetical protein [Candidatus Uhrbacteria bacterium]